MGKVDFEKVSDHNAVVKGKNTIIWRIRITGSVDECYIPAEKIHSKLGGGYWADTKHFIPLTSVKVAQPFERGYEAPVPAVYLDIACGQCGIVNSINQETLSRNQGAHFCKSCRSTIAVVIRTEVHLKNGSKAGNTKQR